MKNIVCIPVGIGLIVAGLLLQVVGAERVGFIVESAGNRLAEPDIMP